MIRLVAPCATACGLLLVGPASVARLRLVDPLYRRLSCCSSSHVIPNHTFPFVRGAFARVADLSFLRSAFALLLLPSPAASRGTAGLLLPAPAPRGVGGAPRGALISPVAPAKRNHRVSETHALS